MKFKQPFKIEVDKEYGSCPDEEPGSAYGRITINDDYEQFYISPSVWPIRWYEEQWNLALEKIKTENKSCFVQNIQDDPFIFMWPIYKVPSEKKIYLHNILIIEDIYEQLIGNTQLTPENIFNFIPERSFGKDLLGNPIVEEEPETELDKLLFNLPPTEWSIEYEG